METIILNKSEDENLFKVSVDGGAALSFGSWVLGRSHVLKQALQSAEQNGVTHGSVSVPAGYFSSWLSYVSDARTRIEDGNASYGSEALVRLLKVRSVSHTCLLTRITVKRNTRSMSTVGMKMNAIAKSA